MANIKSAKKRIKVTKTKTERNKVQKSKIKMFVKNIKNNSEIKKEKIENLTSRVEQLKSENDEKQEDIKRLQTLNKNHIKDYDLLKSNFNKLNNDK